MEKDQKINKKQRPQNIQTTTNNRQSKNNIQII